MAEDVLWDEGKPSPDAAISLMLCLLGLLGLFGLHYFYAGRYRMGLMMALPGPLLILATMVLSSLHIMGVLSLASSAPAIQYSFVVGMIFVSLAYIWTVIDIVRILAGMGMRTFR